MAGWVVSGRARDLEFAGRFVEASRFDVVRLLAILDRHGTPEAWTRFLRFDPRPLDLAEVAVPRSPGSPDVWDGLRLGKAMLRLEQIALPFEEKIRVVEALRARLAPLLAMKARRARPSGPGDARPGPDLTAASRRRAERRNCPGEGDARLQEGRDVPVEHAVGVGRLHARPQVADEGVGREHGVADLVPPGDVRL